MTYGTREAVLNRLNKDPTETDWDGKVERALDQADAEIDNELQRWGAVVPLSPAPKLIVECANDWAAGIVEDEVSQPTSQNPLVVQGPVFSPGDVLELRQNVFTLRAKRELTSYVRTSYSMAHVTKSGGAPY